MRGQPTQAIPRTMSQFSTKAALVTFGGAYVVLPYVYQGAVEHYKWLIPIQMIDGLAFGETSPAPLIMVVTFVSFVGSYVKIQYGPESLFLAGPVAEALVTWFTLLPSFLGILAEGPLVESTHGDLKFTAPFTTSTAADVGDILNQTLFFTYQVLWPHGVPSACQGISALIAPTTAVASFRDKRTVTEVIAICGVIGLILQTLI